jgi:hypothetical protein
MIKDRTVFKIVCGGLTPARRSLLAQREVVAIGRPIRIALAAGGAYMFYYGTSGDAPPSVAAIANIFAVVGIAAALLAIFSHKLAELSFFSKTQRKGCFPAEVLVGEGGVSVMRTDTAGFGSRSKAGGEAMNEAVSNRGERIYAFSAIGNIEETDEYFKAGLVNDAVPCVYLFKEDFEQGAPEAFLSYLDSKKSET